MFKVGDQVMYAGTVALVVEVYTNGYRLGRKSGALFTCKTDDPKLSKATEAEIERECLKVDNWREQDDANKADTWFESMDDEWFEKQTGMGV